MGLGNIEGMRVILRNNREMLRKTGLFKKDRSFLSSRKEYLKAAKGEVELKTISKSELQAIREKVIKNRKVESIKSWLITITIIIPIIVYGIYISNNYKRQTEQEIYHQKLLKEKNNQLLLEQKRNKNLKKYFLIISEGDMWLRKENWNNAIYKYKRAVKLFPNEFEANYRLALAYGYRCQNENKDCDLGEKLTNKLLKYFPEEANLIELKKVFNN